MRTATGRMAGPERPPVLLASTNFFYDIDLHAGNGIDQGNRIRAAAFRRFCNSEISVTFGESFMMTAALPFSDLRVIF